MSGISLSLVYKLCVLYCTAGGLKCSMVQRSKAQLSLTLTNLNLSGKGTSPPSHERTDSIRQSKVKATMRRDLEKMLA